MFLLLGKDINWLQHISRMRKNRNILPDAPVTKDGSWIVLVLRSIRSITWEFKTGVITCSLSSLSLSMVFVLSLSHWFISKSNTSSLANAQQFTPRGLWYVRFLFWKLCSLPLNVVSFNLLRTGNGICWTTRRLLVLDNIVVADFSWNELWQVDGLNSPAVAPLDLIDSGPWVRSCFCLISWKDRVTMSS